MRALLLLLALPLAAGGQTFTDDFSAYPAGSAADPNWDASGITYAVTDGAYVTDDGTSLWQAVPFAAEVTFSADITPLPGQTLKGDWLTAGIGLWADEQNYWALNFVVAPEAQDRRHFVELQERLNNIWLATGQEGSRLPHVANQGNDLDWQVGHTYRFEISLSDAKLEGRVLDGESVVAHIAYRLDGDSANTPAVRAGRPFVRVAGLPVKVDNARAIVGRTAPEPKPEPRVIPAWESRPGKAIAPAAGFFRTAQVDGRWWLVDPEGKPFYIVGNDHVSYTAHWCEALGYSPYHRNVVAKYGSEEAWAQSATDRLKSWGFNTLAAGHSPSTRHRGLAHILFASFGSRFAKRAWICEPIHWTGFPDVFDPLWERHCRLVAADIAEQSADDPWCIGTFLDNELEWYGKKGFLVDEVFQRGPDQAGKQALWDWLIERYDSVAGVNRALGTAYADRAGFLADTAVPPPSPALDNVRNQFLAVIADRYFGVATRALREADPQHLVLGCRFAGRVPTAVLKAAGRANDVFTINTYPRVDMERGVVEGTPRMLTDVHDATGLPMIITEWSFPALDSGLPCQHGAGMRVDTQAQKARCYEIFANQIADLPFMIGYHYFMWADEPELGISSTFPEDSNYGLVDVYDDVYTALTDTATRVNRAAAQRHALSTPSGDLAYEVKGDTVLVRNPSKHLGLGTLTIGRGGLSRRAELRLKPGAQQAVAAPGPGNEPPAVVLLERWDGSLAEPYAGPGTAGMVYNAGTAEIVDVPVVVEHGGAVTPLTTYRLEPGRGIAPKPADGERLSVERLQLSGGGVTWRCDRKDGSLFDSVQAGDLPLGRLVFATHQRVGGQDQWVETDTVESLSVAEQPAGWVVEAVVARSGGGPAITAVDEAGEQEAPQTGPARFRAGLRAVVLRDWPIAMVRPLWVENTDTRPWELVDAFWFCRPAIGGDIADDTIGGPAVPNYYLGPASFLTDAKLGGAFGATCAPGDWRVSFWTDPGGGFHPDSYRAVGEPLAPGARWHADDVPYLWVYALRDASGWRDIVAASRQAGVLRQ